MPTEDLKTTIALVGSGIALASALIAAIASLSISYRSTYLNTVTVERSKWIEKLRVNMSKLISLAHAMHAKLYDDKEFQETDEYKSLATNIVEAMALLRLQLNPDGRVDANILALMPAIQEFMGGDEYKRLERLFVRHIQWLLKDEWEKVKYEARGSIGKIWTLYRMHRRKIAYERFCVGHGAIEEWTKFPN